MAVPKTLVEYWQSEVDRIETQPPAAPAGELPDAKASRDAAAAAETAANAALATSGNKVNDTKSAVEQARQALAGIPMPADSSPLVAAMRTALANWRDAIAEHVGNQADLNARRAERQRWSDRVASLTATLTAAKAELKSQSDIAGKITQWITNAGQAPLKDAKKDADALLVDQTKKDAEAKVKSDFPYAPAGAGVSKFLARARARRDLADAKSDASGALAIFAASQLTAWVESTTRESALTALLRRDYDEAVAALQDLARAGERLTAARSVFNKINARAASPLSAAQQADLNDAGKKAEREAALLLLAKRDAAQADYISAVLDYRVALATEQAKAPEKSQAELLASVASLKTKMDQLDPTHNPSKAKALEVARANIGTTESDALKAWFAAAPDTLWDELDQFDGAVADLNDLAKTAPADLVQNVKDTAEALAKNLDDCRNEQRKEDLLETSATQATALAESDRGLAPGRRQAAVRFVDEV